MPLEIMNPEFVIENEIANGANQKEVAKTYALALRKMDSVDWKRINQAIMDRWPKGLERVKNLAWSGKCFEDSH